MALSFDQMPLPDGVYAMVVDDGTNIVHVFTETAPWPVVRVAMSKCASDYAELRWVRADAVST